MGLIDRIAEKMDKTEVFKFSELDFFSLQKNWISTGSPSLDKNLRVLGYPTGIVEVRGDSQSGKTTFSIHAMKSCISEYRDRAIVTILSSERRDNKELAHNIGLKTDQVLIIPTRTVEQVFTEIGRVVEEGAKAGAEAGIKPRFLFVWDSLGQTVSRQEKETVEVRRKGALKGDEDKNAAMGSAARAISFGLRGFLSMLDEHEITLFIINRAYENIGMFTGGKSSYGGKAMEFFPTMRLELSKKAGIKVGEEEVGQETMVTVVKSDFGPPKAKFLTEIGYGYGLVLSQSDIELGIQLKILTKHGAYGAKFSEKLKWSSRKELYAHYENKNPLLKVLLVKLNTAAHEAVVEERTERLNK